MRAILDKNEPDRKSRLAQQAAMPATKAHAAVGIDQGSNDDKIRDLLNPDQVKQFDEIRAQQQVMRARALKSAMPAVLAPAK